MSCDILVKEDTFVFSSRVSGVLVLPSSGTDASRSVPTARAGTVSSSSLSQDIRMP